MIKCPHCGGNLEEENEQPGTVQTGEYGVPDNVGARGRRDKRGKSRRVNRTRHRDVSGDEMEGDKSPPVNARTVTISVELNSGKYEGPARIIDEERMIVSFPWKGKKNHHCLIAKSEIIG